MKIKKQLILLAGLLMTISCSNPDKVTTQMPHLKKVGNTTQLIVDGKPFIMISGELHNSSSSSIEYMKDVWKRIEPLNMNTLIASASWDVVEAEEGKYNFKEIDALIEEARARNMKLVLIWFASWKNGNSTYAPEWVKTNPNRFPKVVAHDGRTLDVLSTFHEANREADEKAYLELMKHIKKVDHDNTIIMVQMQNEVGILGAERDYSPTAEEAWNSQVPEDLMNYLQQHKGKLFPELEKVWAANGYKTKGNWEEIFGKSIYPKDYTPDQTGFNGIRGRDSLFYEVFYGLTEEIFMAYHYAKYMGKIAEAGKKIHNIPVYVNAWLRQPGGSIPGRYPSGGPTPEVLDIYRAAGPSIDLIAPDIYIEEYDWVLSEYTRSGNPLFIPENTLNAARALYAFGEYDALGFAPFGIDGGIGSNRTTPAGLEHLTNTYRILNNMIEVITSNFGSEKMRGLIVDQNNPQHTIEMGNFIITATLRQQRRAINTGQSLEQLAAENAALARQAQEQSSGGAIVLHTDENEFVFVGYGINLQFRLKDAIKHSTLDIASKDEGTFIHNVFVPGRRLNGDERGAGLPEQTGAMKVRLYYY